MCHTNVLPTTPQGVFSQPIPKPNPIFGKIDYQKLPSQMSQQL
jgi:hypothetical protein